MKKYSRVEDGVKKYYTGKQVAGEAVQNILGGILFFGMFFIGALAFFGF